MTKNGQPGDRDTLFDFGTPPDQIRPQLSDDFRWYTGEQFNFVPSKSAMRGDGLANVLAGWKPPHPIINADTRVFALGSCFAAYFVRWLGDQNYNRRLEAPYQAIAKSVAPFENVSVIAQQFRWAFGDVDPSTLFWVNPDRQIVEATDERRQLMRSTIEDAEVLIITLGLSEVWYDRLTGEPLWRAVPMRNLDPDRHAFKVLSVAETVDAFETIERIRAEHVPKLRIVYTVSPVRFRATFRPISALTATSASKAILRAALDEFLRAHWDLVNATYFYFPSYEIVLDVFRDPFDEDSKHPHETAIAQVLATFARHYTDLGTTEDDPRLDESYLPEQTMFRRIEELEARGAELKRSATSDWPSSRG